MAMIGLFCCVYTFPVVAPRPVPFGLPPQQRQQQAVSPPQLSMPPMLPNGLPATKRGMLRMPNAPLPPTQKPPQKPIAGSISIVPLGPQTPPTEKPDPSFVVQAGTTPVASTGPTSATTTSPTVPTTVTPAPVITPAPVKMQIEMPSKAECQITASKHKAWTLSQKE